MSEFDFDKHRAAAISAYAAVRPTYETFARTLKHLLEICLEAHPVHTIEARAKTIKSFAEKSGTPDESGLGPKYLHPLDQITDLCGVRVIAYFPNALAGVEKVITEQFDILERSDKSTAFEKSGRLGYQSIHLLVRLRSDRDALREYAPFKGIIAEVQIRTVLQHAWAEMEHDIQYKALDDIPTEIRRRFAALAGLIEIADREFQAIQDADVLLRKSIRDELVGGISPASDSASSTDTSPTTAQTASTSELREAATSAAERGDYADAVARYNRMIENEPSQFTLYLGRANARFLGGDRAGALRDLDAAERLAPGNRSIQNARQRIDEGVQPTNSDAIQIAYRGHDRLAAGDPAAALREYAAADALGLPTSFTAINKAMAFILLGRYDDAEGQIDSLTPAIGSPTRVNCEAIRAIIAFFRSSSESDFAALRQSLVDAPNYQFNRSPLRFLESGIRALVGGDETDSIFVLLRHRFDEE